MACEHQHIRHETKRRTVCVDCNCRMVRDKGSWRAADGSEGGAQDEDEESGDDADE